MEDACNTIIGVEPGSPAAKAGITPGMCLLGINGRPVRDVLDYKFAAYEPRLTLTLEDASGVPRQVPIRHGPGSDLGLQFETYLMDRQHTCRNRCVFCFIDQLPKGLRKPLYFKDDDARLSFLLGQYITLTNLSEEEIDRIHALRISPLHISVHVTDPAARVRMLGNPGAGKCLSIMQRFAERGIMMHAQVVVCPGYNDGALLEKTLADLDALRPMLDSVSIVPVGLTKHREHLPPLAPVLQEGAQAILALAEAYERVYCSDELYLRAGIPIPDVSHYEEFSQLENGVGMMALFEEQWREEPLLHPKPFSLATGTAAGAYMQKLLQGISTEYTVYIVENKRFGESVTVAGLLCGEDIADALRGKLLHGRLLIPRSMLRHEGDMFLDDMTPAQLEVLLGVPVVPVDVDGNTLRRAIEAD